MKFDLWIDRRMDMKIKWLQDLNSIFPAKKILTTAMSLVMCIGILLPGIGTAKAVENDAAWVDNILMYDDTAGEDWLKRKVFDIPIRRQQVRSVTFLDAIPDVSVRTWDVSADKSGRVIAWIERNGTLYDLYIAADGGINAAGDACVRLFDNYNQMVEINFNNAFHTDYAENMTGMFSACFSLTELDVSQLVTSNVTNMERIFACLPVSRLDISNFDTGNVTNMNSMFAECKALSYLDLSGMDTSAAVDMKEMFADCENLISVNVDGWDTSRVRNMNAMFHNCKAMTSLDLSGFDTSNVVDMACMFLHCDSLQNLELGNWEVNSVLHMGDFYSQTNLPDGTPWTSLFW